MKKESNREMFGKEDEDLDNLTKFLEEDCVEKRTRWNHCDDLKKEKRNSIDDLLAEIDEISVDSSHNRKEEKNQKSKNIACRCIETCTYNEYCGQTSR